MQPSNQRVTPLGISTLCIWSKANLMYCTLLTGYHNLHFSVSHWFLIVMMSSWWILLYWILLWGWVDFCPWASLSAHYLLSHCIREACHLTNLLTAVGKSWGQLHYQCGQKNYEHWNHSLGNFGYRWGRQEKSGNDNCLLQIWSSEDRTFGCTFNLSPAQPTWSRCSSGEGLH